MKRLLTKILSRYLGDEKPMKIPEKSCKKYRKSGLTREQAATIREKIQLALEEDHLYRNNALGLDDLADHIQHNRYKVSQVINTYFSKNFYSFLNEYRIQEAKILLEKDPELSVKVIMYEVGFNSKNSFYSSFKKVTGLSPNDYRNIVGYEYDVQMA
ncbi:helix-turn-helix domain-containing protein [Flagellimonas sediminis]|uniref:Helix-turn-helix domain-containing protein n=1 Tax=Flagellimonas sediminis TaxID=2696468 RepID=A0A6I5L5P2_9FLAO|nr:helix-turn-helix domain-containing protein [Allomuricauda sediminis]NDV44200.1 helix-turn-helix domain-containing protein [Allomuricauda sediminis]